MLNQNRRINVRLLASEVRSMSSIPVSTVDTRDLRPELPAPPLRIAVFAVYFFRFLADEEWSTADAE